MSLRHRQDRASVGEEATPFLGRAAELAAIEAGIEGVCGGRGALDIFSGAAGIGKTRLLREAGWRAATRGCRVLSGGAWEGEGAPAFWPWIEVLRSYVSMHEAGLARRATTDFRALLRDALEGREPGAFVICPDIDTDAHQARFALFDRFCDFLASLARDAPLVITLDDMHWSDPAALLLLQFVAGRLAALPVWLCVASREPLPDALALSTRHPWAHHVPLRGLEPDDIAHVLRAAGCSPGPDLLRQLVTLSEGNPYFAAELGKLLSTSPPPLPGGRLSLPPTLIALVHQQLARLSPACRNLLQVAAVIGRDFDTTLVAAAMDAPPAAILELIEEAIAGRVLIPLSPTQMRFVHVLTREAIYDGLPVSARTQLHHRLAVRHPSQPDAAETNDTVVQHLYNALPLCDSRAILPQLVLAGRHTYDTYAFEDSCRHLERALSLAPWLPAQERCDLLIDLGSAQVGAGHFPQWRSTFVEAAALARRIDSPRHFARAALGLRGLMWATIPPDIQAIQLLEEAVARLRDAPNTTELMIEVLGALSRSLYFSHDATTSRHYVQEAAALASGTTDTRARALALEAHIVSILDARSSLSIIALADELYSLALAIYDPLLISSALLFRHFGFRSTGSTDAADECLDRLAHLAHQEHNARLKWLSALLRSARETQLGHFSSAEGLLDIAAQAGARVHDPSRLQYEISHRFYCALLRDELDDWLGQRAGLRELLPDVPAVKACLALLEARAGHFPESRTLLQPIVDSAFSQVPWNHSTLWTYSVIAETIHLLGDASWATRLIDILLPLASFDIVAGWGVALDGSLSHYVALLATTLERHDLAAEHFEIALRENALRNAPVLLARTQLAYAQFLTQSRHSDHEQTRLLAISSARAYQSLHLERPSAQADRLVEQLGTPAPAVPDKPLRGKCTPTDVSQARLVHSGDHWLLTFGGQTAIVRSCIGLQYLSAILAASGHGIHVLDLVSRYAPSTQPYSGGSTPDLKSARAYRTRLRELTRDIELAELSADSGELTRLLHEREMLESEISRTFGQTGRVRPTGTPSERARIRVRNRLSTALTLIERAHPKAAAHFRSTVRTGTVCYYRPPEPLTWETAS